MVIVTLITFFFSNHNVGFYLLQKLRFAILRWYRFLIDWHIEGLLMTGEGSQDLWKVCGVCVCCVRRASRCVYACEYLGWEGFTSVPLSLLGQVPPTIVRACPCGRLHLQTPKKRKRKKKSWSDWETIDLDQQVSAKGAVTHKSSVM